ncbi:MAG: hypothetical protein ACRDH6_09555 [Actinomycetota bacterium]
MRLRRRPRVHRLKVRVVFFSPELERGSSGWRRSPLARLARLGLGRRRLVEASWPPPADAEDLLETSDLAVYELESNFARHREVYRLATRYPGLVILHEVDLRPLIRGLIANGDRLGERSRNEASSIGRALGASPEAASAAFVARRARCVIVHSDEDRESIEALDVRTAVVALSRDELVRLPRLRRLLRMHDGATRALERVVEDTLRLLGDPARRAAARWAESLTDCGATLDSVQKGDGGRYAEALAEMAGGSGG